MRIEERLCAHYEEFSENEKYVCHCLSGHLEEFGGKTLERAAADLNVSKTLLVRFAKKLGLSGYSELRARIRLERKEEETCMEGDAPGHDRQLPQDDGRSDEEGSDRLF